MMTTEEKIKMVQKFMKTAETHGTTIEAVTSALDAAVNGEARSIEEALDTGASEWFK